MAIIHRPLQMALVTASGSEPVSSGRWRMCSHSDEDSDPVYLPLCDCPQGHESPEAASACPVVVARLAHVFPSRPPRDELGRRAYEAYNTSVEGSPVPAGEWAALPEYVREAWCAAADAARGA